jgi:hypothetical protein
MRGAIVQHLSADYFARMNNIGQAKNQQPRGNQSMIDLLTLFAVLCAVSAVGNGVGAATLYWLSR